MVTRRFREERREAARQVAGQHWSDESTREEVPVNLLSLYISIIGRSLIAKAPRALLSTFDQQLKPVVSAMQSWANKEIQRMRLAETLQRSVTDALYCVGITKVALASPADAAGAAWSLGAGQPYAERVDLDDFVYDTHARSFNEAAYIGHRFRVPREAAIKTYGRKVKDIAASTDQLYNKEGDERIGVLGRSYYSSDATEFEDMVDLWEIYLTRHRQVIVLADEYLTGQSPIALSQKRWLGPDTGPYHFLGFNIIPGNAMPKGPITDLIDLHRHANSTYRKLMRAMQRMKEITFVQGGASEDGSRTQAGNDGDIIKVDNPQNIAQVVMGGQHAQVLMAIATEFKNLFSFLGGNLELLGGRGAQSKTATQDELLNQNAGAGVADMQDRTLVFVQEVCKSLLWYWWNDPFQVQKSKYALPSLPEIELVRQVTPLMRQRGRFEDLDLEIDPYSMRHQTPESRMAALDQVMTQVLVPLAPVLQQQNIAPDFHAYLEKKAKYMDMPDLPDIATIAMPPPMDTGPAPERPGMPTQTTRNYTRTSLPGRTPQGDEQNRMNAMLGVNPGGNPQTSKNGQQPLMK